MATTVDDQGYAYVVLICSGQFSDPGIECRLTDITRQLHMLATGSKEPLVTSVEPWNSVRVTLKVSRESAALLQTLAQQQDPKLLDIGILSLQVEGSSPVCLDCPTEVSSKLTPASSRVNVDSSLRFATNSSTLVGDCQSAVHGLLSQTAVSSVQEVTGRASGLTSNVNLSWHPLVDQRSATSGDDASCSWDPFGYNGLSVDPFQFSADDLLTRMLADVPAPKRRQRVRKGSAALATHMPFPLSNPVSLAVHEDCNSKVQLSNELYAVTYGTTFGIPVSTQSHAPQKTTYFDNDRKPADPQLTSPFSSQVSDVYGARANNDGVLSSSSHLLYNHPQQNMSSAAGILPQSLDSLMTVSNHTVSSDQPPIKRRHVKSRNSTSSHSTVTTYSAVSEINQHSPFRDVCNEGAVGDTVATNSMNVVKSAEMTLPAAPDSRYGVHSPRALWSDVRQGHPVIPTRYPNVDAYRFRLPCRQSCSWTQNNSSDMYSDMPTTGALPFVSDVRKPFSFAGGVASRPSFTVSLPNHNVSTANETSIGTTWRRCHQQLYSTVELRHGSSCDRLSISAGYPLSSTTTCTSLVDQPHVSGIGNRPLPASSHVGLASETCNTVDYCGTATSSVQPPGIVQSTSPRDVWAGSDSDYGGASVTDSGIASNTSLSIGSDHSENDRGSVEMNAVEPSISAKLSPVSTADRICAPSSPVLASSTDSLSEPQCDGSVTSSCGVMRMNPLSAGQNGESCIAAAKHSGKPQNWLGDSGHSDNKKSASSAQMRLARRSRQTPTLAGECPPAITCPSLPRRLSESVKRAMRGGAATDPPMATAPCDIGPTKVVIRITKTRCSGTGEAKRSKQKEQWCVQPIVKQSPTPSDVANTYNGTLHCSTTNSAKESSDSDSVFAAGSFDKSPHRKEFDVALQHSAVEKRDLSQSSDFSGRLKDSVVYQTDLLQPTVPGEQAAGKMACSDQNVATPAAVSHDNGADSVTLMQNLT